MKNEAMEALRSQVKEQVVLLGEGGSAWVYLSDLGNSLRSYGIQYRQYGYEKLRPFLEYFDELEFKAVEEDDKPPVYYVRLKGTDDSSQIPAEQKETESESAPGPDWSLKNWAYIFGGKYHTLVERMPEENWGKREMTKTKEDGTTVTFFVYPKLQSYIANTARRLAFEGKILYSVNPRDGKKCAAFHTGLVDKSYDWIYALFTENDKEGAPWKLIDFVVAGENAGKLLTAAFRELPMRANYFEKAENVLFDTERRLECDYGHFLLERAHRLPAEFIRAHCPDFATIDGVTVEQVAGKKEGDETRDAFYTAFSKKLSEDQEAYNRMKCSFKNAVDMALKQVAWNYKTAVPMYYPTRNKGALLLPISLVDPERTDLALVVTAEDSGAYQGQTILPLEWAYDNSRLVTRPNSEWLLDS